MEKNVTKPVTLKAKIDEPYRIEVIILTVKKEVPFIKEVDTEIEGVDIKIEAIDTKFEGVDKKIEADYTKIEEIEDKSKTKKNTDIIKINIHKFRGELKLLKMIISKRNWKEVFDNTGDIFWSG